jgi:nicotinate-nucleotide adenylyltransferase
MIGIMGGTFDPIHYGHLRTALEAAEALSLQQVLFIPTHTPLLKQHPTCSGQDRVNMLKLALKETPLFQLDEREIAREGYSYTVDTLSALCADYPTEQLVFLLGADAFAAFKQWKNWQAIMRLVHLVVLHRPDYSLDQLAWQSQQWITDAAVLQRISSGGIFPLAVTQLSISSTFIRQQIALQKNVRFLLPDPVINYIMEQRLYT